MATARGETTWWLIATATAAGLGAGAYVAYQSGFTRGVAVGRLEERAKSRPSEADGSEATTAAPPPDVMKRLTDAEIRWQTAGSAACYEAASTTAPDCQPVSRLAADAVAFVPAAVVQEAPSSSREQANDGTDDWSALDEELEKALASGEGNMGSGAPAPGTRVGRGVGVRGAGMTGSNLHPKAKKPRRPPDS